MVQPNVKTAVIAAARENRSLSSCIAPSCMATVRVLDIASSVSWRCEAAPVRVGHLTTWAAVSPDRARLKLSQNR
jgi:hypothetical protein